MGERILYIDDDEGIRRLAARVLGRKGFDITTAASGPEGTDLARMHRFDLIAVDHYMPGQDGLTTLAHLRALPDCPPIVYVTGSEESRIAVAALKSGADDYVVKSVGEDFFDLLASTFAQVLEHAGLVRAKARVEEELRISNARLEALLKEVNHRVANNLQMVMAFVGMQARSVSDPGAQEALRSAQQRIAAIAHVNRRLYGGGDVEFVRVDEYLTGLADDLAASWSNPEAPRTVRALTEPVTLRTDKAVSLGMIANELVSNACKYAYPQGSGEVRILLRQQGEQAELVVEDDGIGFSPGAEAKGTGLGTRLIEVLARSHGASVEYGHPPRGARTILRIPLDAGERQASMAEATAEA